MHHQGGPVTVAVKGKPRATGTLVPDIPKYFCPVLLIECVPRINDEEPPVLFLGVLLTQQYHGVYPGIQSCPHDAGQLFCPSGGLSLFPRHPKQALFHQPPPILPNSDWSDPWLLVRCNPPDAHHGAVSGPWGPPIAQPLHEVRNNHPQLPTGRLETQ